MKKYPSIEQFRHVVRVVRTQHDFQGKDQEGNPIYQHLSNYPVLRFRGTVKVHGTNAAIVKYADGRIEYQSRERVLSLEKDNAGFMQTMVMKNLDFLFSGFHSNEYTAVYGEWSGGNIQGKVAITGLPKMFIVFGVKTDNEWQELPSDLHNNEEGIYNINQFPVFDIDINFENPELSQNKLIDLTIAVEENCPVGQYFGKTGIGEGIVFKCVSDPTLVFKSKGEKHSSSKVKTLNAVDIEQVNSINEFVETVVTESRLDQGLSYFKENNIEITPKNTGVFLGWVVKDVLKEESDVINESKLDVLKVKNAVVVKSRNWFLNTVNQL